MVLIRRADPDEGDCLADLMWRVRVRNLATIAPPVHPIEDMRRWMCEVVLVEQDVWVADEDGILVALMVLSHPEWLKHLYIDASHTGQGLGAGLVKLAKAELPGQIQLWTFQSNTGARRFYERLGFAAVEWTDGDNEESAPDVRYLYAPAPEARRTAAYDHDG